jgi:hypothetical protein
MMYGNIFEENIQFWRSAANMIQGDWGNEISGAAFTKNLN